MKRRCHADPPTGAFGGAPYGATNRVRGVPKWQCWVEETHVGPPTGAFGGAPYGATERVRGEPKRVGNRMWTLPLGPSVELPRGHEPCEECAEMVGAAACERCHWGLRWSSLGGHEPCEGCAEIVGAAACGPCHWGLRWSSLWGYET